jgi:3-phenylpropionate/trans-cinnamate dioxygenase ferredoxin reductase subunit
VADHIVIVGASLAGMHAAQALRRHGFDGRVTVVDADPHTPYDKPPLSKQVLAGEWERDRLVLAPAREDLGLDYRLGVEATSLDPGSRSVVLADGERLTYDGLVLAVGAAARRLPAAEGLAGTHVLRSLDDCLALRADLDANPRRVVVIGAGFVGAEVASTCRERGLEVSMVDILEAPMERALGLEVGGVFADLHRDHGVDVRLGVGVDGFDGADRVEAVRLADGSVLDADVVVVGIGVAPATDWLEGSGLTIDNGIVVDETLLAAPGVTAAGDAARWPSRRYQRPLRIEHWDTAIQMGEAAARRLLAGDGPGETFDPLPTFWSSQYDRRLQLSGHAGGEDRVEVVIGSMAERRFVALYEHAGRVAAVLGLNRPRHVTQLQELAADAVPWEEGLARARELA